MLLSFLGKWKEQQGAYRLIQIMEDAKGAIEYSELAVDKGALV